MPASNSSPGNNGRSSRPGGSKQRMVVLKLSPTLLARFADPPVDAKNTLTTPTKEKTASSSSSSPADPVVLSSVNNASDAASTSATLAASGEPSRRKSLPGTKSGNKRSSSQMGETQKSRSKPGPKKKPKLEEGPSDHQAKPVPTGHRLGPRANTGAINAGLRALDRSGAPCRKWEKKPLQLKSFTGIMWQLPTWRAPRPPKIDVNGEPKATPLESGDSDSKANNSTSAAPSEKSNSGDGELTPFPPAMVDSPSPAIAMAA